MPLRAPDMEATLRRWVDVLQHAAPTLAATALILVIAWLLAELTWALLPQPKSVAGAYAPTPVAVAHQPVAGSIADRHLFGTSAPTNSNVSNAPDTTLALTLHGIVAGKSAKDSRALIVANGDEEPYAVGASLPGGAVIRAIFPDRVMLERDGRMEALRLPKADSGTGMATADSPPAAQAASAPLPQNLGQLRQEIVNNPQRLMDVIRAMPVQEQGKLTGYRIYPAGNSPVFAQLGLHPGDVVTAVNGIPLTDPAQSMRVLASIKTSEQISITLLRNGQIQSQVLQMPSGQPGDDGP
ncbi:MAG TPA: type II secretion system protein GspC [Gammaproteobacteria bacterium]|nr:type II secretion system protein GspC [Gammaproteobacteria bacterium]